MSIPVSKNEIVTVEIVGLTHEGEGVGRVDGFTLFVRGALPGERVQAKVLKVKKQYGYAKLLELLETSPDRVSAPCDIYNQCGGCQLQHMSYEAQLSWKRQHVVDNLQRIGKLQVAGTDGQDVNAGAGRAEGGGAGGGTAGVEAGNGVGAGMAAGDAAVADGEPSGGARDGAGSVERAEQIGIRVHDTLGMSDPWRYRNKAQVPVGMSGAGFGGNAVPSRAKGARQAERPATAEGELIAGFYAQGSHRIIDMDRCLIQDERNDAVVRLVKQIGRRLGITAYDEQSGRGLLRHVVVRTGYVSGEMMVVLVTNGSRIPQVEQWIEGIRSELPAVTSIVQNVNKKNTNVIFGDETRVLWGQEVIYDELDGIRFAISARSFYQVNPQQTVALYRKAVEYAGLTGTENVIDAYCGIGTISLFLARQAGQVYGVEIVPEAIEDAKRNAALNGIDNATFEAGPAEVVIPRWKQEGNKPDVIVVDPPRKGCDSELLETILAMQPERVVYVSCNPSTLARDLRVLEDGGYRTVEVQPVDMFPHTTHVECVVGICRVDT